MPAPNELVWYKWFPVKAMTSLRFVTLTLAEEGFYRRLYDLASIAQPSNRRGYVYEHDRPASVPEIARMLRTRSTIAAKMLQKFAQKGLVEQDENGAWGFSNFAKHQQGGPLRKRKDGLGSAEAGTQSVVNRSETGRIDADADAEVQKKEKNPPIPPSHDALEFDAELKLVERLYNEDRTTIKTATWAKSIKVAKANGATHEQIEGRLNALIAGSGVVPEPWKVFEGLGKKMAPHRKSMEEILDGKD